MFEVELLYQPELEFSDAYDWYEEQQPGLGNKLFKEVSHYLSLIETNPFQFQVRYDNDKNSVVKNFSLSYYILD